MSPEYRQLGRSGLRVSVPILGGMTFGNTKWNPWLLTEEQSLPLLKAAWDAGVNTIDTANTYSNGDSERIIGNFIKQYSIPRETLVIMTKALFLVSSDPGVKTMLNPSLGQSRDFVNQGGLSRTAIFNQIDASLLRLGTSYIDLLQIHAFDPSTPVEETMRALHDLVLSGKVRYLGACNLRAWQLAEMNRVAELHGWTPFVSIQVEHSLLYRPQELEMFAYCNYKGIGILSYSPLMDGNLARPLDVETARVKSTGNSPFKKKLRASDREIVKRVNEVSQRLEWKMSQVALAWSVSKVTSPIVGVNSIERLYDAIVSDRKLSTEDIQYLEELRQIGQPSPCLRT
ncbi:predicted protein [Postia placenta Mad-698-R]|nr:predicted protein [Postia placenta Mad-698-R]